MISVIIPTHNPDPHRLRRTLSGLRVQTLATSAWEVILVDNASRDRLVADAIVGCAPSNYRVVREPVLGLTSARRRGVAETQGEIVVFVDDDNVLAPTYLEEVVRIFAQRPHLGAAGGRSIAEFEQPPEPWAMEFLPLLAIRDLGNRELIAALPRNRSDAGWRYPDCAPIGAGLAARRDALAASIADGNGSKPLLPDRHGHSLSSAGDNDLVFCILRAGYEVGYFPQLELTHLIPKSRVQPEYLARLNRGIQCSWMQMLTKHRANPWPPIARWTVPLRQAKAWFIHRAWTGPSARIRWQGACGHFAGRAFSRSHTFDHA